jgi:hypothetical protein
MDTLVEGAGLRVHNTQAATPRTSRARKNWISAMIIAPDKC